MAQFKYIGEKEKMPNVYGYDFSGHAVVDVPDSDERTVKKLTNNGHFEFVEPVKKRKYTKKTPLPVEKSEEA